MSRTSSPLRAPRNILLATDLSSHCDRALDRAAQLARQWDAALHVVHALRPDARPAVWWSPERGRPQSGTAHMELIERQIRHDVPGEPPNLVIHVDEGMPVDVIMRTATREQCDLIIAGTSGPTFASIIANTTTEQLLRRSPQSLLVVKARAREAYRRILVGTDFTTESRHGLETAAAWFDNADLTLLHALDIPYRSMLRTAESESELTRLEHDAMDAFLAGAQLSDASRKRIDTRITFGHPESVLSEHGLDHDIDLTIMGALARGLVFHMLVGGNAARILQTVPGDVLMVRDANTREPQSLSRT